LDFVRVAIALTFALALASCGGSEGGAQSKGRTTCY
jgi:hypothetical protein